MSLILLLANKKSNMSDGFFIRPLKHELFKLKN